MDHSISMGEPMQTRIRPDETTTASRANKIQSLHRRMKRQPLDQEMRRWTFSTTDDVYNMAAIGSKAMK
jgi:hypothetical protein